MRRSHYRKAALALRAVMKDDQEGNGHTPRAAVVTSRLSSETGGRSDQAVVQEPP
jgi:hypothetical protein